MCPSFHVAGDPAYRAEETATMSKAIYGHLAGRVDPRLVEEVRRLRHRVVDLESALTTARSENDRLIASMRVGDDDLLHLSDLEHATI